MMPYALSHLMLGGAFFVLALLHFATWLAVRTQRVQFWLATSFLGFALLAFSTGLTSREASVTLADTRFWLLVGAIPSLFLPYALLRVVWSLLDVPLTRWRRVLLGVALLCGAVRVVAASWSILTFRSNQVTAEGLSRATADVSLPMFWLLATVVASAWAGEGLRLLKRRGAMAVAVVVASVLALGLLGRELAVDAGWVSGRQYFALVGVPFLLLASSALAILTARSLRGADLGTGIHRYRRLARLGRGGMGEVWLTLRMGREGFHRLVVLKRMLDDDDDNADNEDALVRMQRFMGEARTAARLHHPNIVSVHDLGQLEGGWFIVMEYLSGASTLELAQRVAGGSALPLEVVVEVCQQALRGIAYAHERGVIHRDISSDNLIVSFDGVVKVVDFGIAHGAEGPRDPVAARRPTTGSVDKRLTQVGNVIGKEAYMPPERIEGAEATASGDLFALGRILYELLFGDLPDFPSTGLRLPDQPRPEAPVAYAQLRAVLDKALQPDVSRRFTDARAFLHALEPVRQALPPVDLSLWMRDTFKARWARQRRLVDLEDPSPAEVAPLLVREPVPRPVVLHEAATREIATRPSPAHAESATKPFAGKT
ncbi:protein kinase [Archangium primigenium]|nr:protein kinase [Archangium primigenium]